MGRKLDKYSFFRGFVHEEIVEKMDWMVEVILRKFNGKLMKIWRC